MKRIRVLYILNTTLMGGGNLSFINMIKELKDAGIEIYIAHPDEKPNIDFMSRTKGLVSRYYYVDLKPWVLNNSSSYKHHLFFLFKKLLKTALLWFAVIKERKQLQKIIRSNSIDVIHTNVGVIRGGYYAAKRAGIPHVWHLREYQTLDFDWEILPSKKAFERLLYHSYVITITDNIKKYFNLDNSAKAVCIYNGCFSKNDVYYKYPKQKYFLCSSRVSKEKGIDESIRAFADFINKSPNNHEYKLIIAGFGRKDYIQKLKELAALYQVDDCVKFVGFQNDIKPLMDNATAIIVSSYFEGFGRMTAEAEFRGCIVIGRNTGGTKEIVEETNGFLFSGDFKSLSNILSNVVALSCDEYHEIAEDAQRKAVELFSTERSACRILDFYKQIIN